MNKFNIGDKVRCIDNGGWSNLTKNKIYVVRQFDASYIYINDDNGFVASFLYSRFVVEKSVKIENKQEIDYMKLLEDF